jgi:pSer/pThr/pTyr-binding forkhead associated (FHA) protein
VLRDRSVSKFHAWFERGAAGALLLADAGSKNGTSVNGDQTVPRELTNVKAGDVVRFGSVEAVICTPDALWRAAQPR